MAQCGSPAGRPTSSVSSLTVRVPGGGAVGVQHRHRARVVPGVNHRCSSIESIGVQPMQAEASRTGAPAVPRTRSPYGATRPAGCRRRGRGSVQVLETSPAAFLGARRGGRRPWTRLTSDRADTGSRGRWKGCTGGSGGRRPGVRPGYRDVLAGLEGGCREAAVRGGQPRRWTQSAVSSTRGR